MATPLIDFSHLTPAERIELAAQLWESLDPAVVEPAAADAELLRTRRAALEVDGDPGTPWRETIEELSKRGE